MRTIDLNLLLVFDAVMAERNLRRAALRLNRSQPAVSQAIARLRDLWADQLFRRTPTGVDPTPRAEAIWAEVREPLQQIKAQLAPDSFRPEDAIGEARIGLSDDVHLLAFAEIVPAVRARAPRLALRVVEVDHQSVWPMVRSGFVDVAVTVAEPAPRGLAARVVARQGFVVIRRADMAPPGSLVDYLRHDHVAVAFSEREPGYTDRRLESLGHARRVIASTPRFSAIPDLVMRTGALATLPEPVARAFAAHGGLALSPCPFDLTEVNVLLGWHLARQADPFERLAKERGRTGRQRAGARFMTLAASEAPGASPRRVVGARRHPSSTC
jgi:LysR family transcriptional activator of mexEF-oprN operon